MPLIFLLLAAATIAAPPLLAGDEGGGGERPALPDKPEPDLEPGHDVERGPRGDGAEFRRLTPLTEAELESIHPRFRALARRIAEGTADKRVMRIYWYSRSRLDPFDRPIPDGWRQQANAVLRDRERSRAGVEAFYRRGPQRETETVVPPAGALGDAAATLRGEGAGIDTHGLAPAGVWVPIGPFNIPGRMSGLARPPGPATTLYATAADGGLWKTLDLGQTWTPLSDFEATLSSGVVLLDPNDPETIYLGTGEGNASGDNYPGIGVLKSTDGGLTWTESNEFSDEVRNLAMHEDQPTRLFAAGRDGCYVSTDGAATFSLIANGLPTGQRASDVVIHPNDADTVYCAIWGGASPGVYKTTDGGATWVAKSSGLPGSTGRIALALSASNPDILIAAVDVSSGTVYKTTDGGETWALPGSGGPGHCGGQCWYDNAVAIDPVDPDVLYAGGINTYGSQDGGVTWSLVSSSAGGRGAPNYVHVDQHRIFTPTADEVILANDGGVFRSTDRGATWTDISIGLDTTQFYGICRHPTDAFWSMGGTQDNGTERRRATDDPQWQNVIGADGGMCMHGPPATDIVLGETQNMNIRRSVNGGDSWTSANGGIDPFDPKAWVGIMVADPSDRNNMWAGTNKVYRSEDARATNWDSVSSELAGGSLIGALEVAPSDSERVYVGFSNGQLHKSEAALRKNPRWDSIRDAAMPNRGVRRIRAAAADADTAYVVFNGFGSGKLWKTTDGGATWADRTGDHPDVPINDVFVDPGSPGTLLTATDLGVYRSDDDGATWYGFSTGLPGSAAIEFTYDGSADVLRIGTHGRSIWEWQEAAATALAVPDGATAGGQAMTVQRIGDSGQMRVAWDVRSCTAQDYVLLAGDLDAVAARSYSSAECGLGTSGFADVPLPATPSGNAFFVVVATDGAGTEGPHGYDGSGTPVTASGTGFCGIAAQDTAVTCP